MKNRQHIRLTALCLLAAMLLSLFSGCRNEKPDPSDPPATTQPGQAETTQPVQPAQKVTHTVTLVNEALAPLAGVGVYIYTDLTMQELVWFARTDENGAMTFTDVESDSYIAVLTEVMAGYEVAESYLLTGTDTRITLAAGLLDADALAAARFRVGDVMPDFAITDCDGNEYLLSGLLEEKKAVVLNFWYLQCDPCKAEFPYLQEAYAQYSQDIAVLAMNPVNTDPAEVAQFRTENGITFPMGLCPIQWEAAMQITGYPTTVVIDRTGTISLVHTGSVPDAKAFADTFAYFTAEDYVPGVVESMEQLRTEEPKGSANNPTEIGGVTSFELTVEPGQVVYVDLYKAIDRYMKVNSGDAYVLYNDKTYYPSDGYVGLMVSCPDNYTPAKLGFGNSSEEIRTFKITLSALPGSNDNPYSLKVGEFTAKVSRGNDQGVNYTYKVTADGVLKLECLGATEGVDYSFVLYNLNTYAYRTLGEDGGADPETGLPTVTVKVSKGDKVRVIVGTLPDSSNAYPAGTFQLRLSLEEGSGSKDDEEQVQLTDYAVTVTDGAGTSVAGVSVRIQGGDTDTTVKTGSDGIAAVTLPAGEYTATVIIPEGYTLQTTQYILTAEAPAAAVQLEKIVYHDYTVTVTDPEGRPISGVLVMVGSGFVLTDEAGEAVFHLVQGDYTAYLSLPEGFTAERTDLPFGTETELRVTLDYAPGTEGNPIWVHEVSLNVAALAPGSAVYYDAWRIDGMELTVADPDAWVKLGEQTYTADPETGVLTLVVPTGDTRTPVALAVGNGGLEKKDLTVTFTYPVGSWQNPVPVEAGSVECIIAEGSEGVWYAFDAAQVGDVTVEVAGESWAFAVENPLAGRYGDYRYSDIPGSESRQTLAAAAGDRILILVNTCGEGYSAAGGTVTLTVSFTGQGGEPEVPTEPTEPSEPSEPTEPTEPSEPTEPTEPSEPSEPTEPSEPSAPENTDYTVTVTDYDGNALGGVMVLILKDGVQQTMAVTDGQGRVSAGLATGEYTVSLAFTDGKARYYENATAVLTANAPNLTLRVTDTVPSGEKLEHWALNTYYDVYVGATYVTMQPDIVNYFVFTPEEAGTYRFASSDPAAAISYWGSISFPMDLTETVTVENNGFCLSIAESSLGQSYVLGTTGAADTILVITRSGDAEIRVEDLPFDVYQNKTAPEAFTLTLSEGQKLAYVALNGTNVPVYSAADGCYHLGGPNGPVLYVNLGYDAPYVSMKMMLKGDGLAGGTALRKYFYDGQGNFLKKEDYTDAMLAYIECADPVTGLYPLTADLSYMLQNGGGYMGWWDSQSPNFLFADVEGLVPPLAWMFAVCYVSE